MINKNDRKVMMLHFVGIILGLFGLLFVDSENFHILYIVSISIILILSVAVDRFGWIHPYSFLMLSFFVFVWMRYILNLIYKVDIISVGNGINLHNTNLVSIWLGIAMNTICIVAIVSAQVFFHKLGKFYRGNSRLAIPLCVEKIVLGMALCFFCIFLYDSYQKVSIVQTHNYLDISESVLLEGYKWFSIGKWMLLLWIILGKDEKRFLEGSFILLVAGLGYLMRGARGYAIMYIFLVLLFFSFKKKIKVLTLLIMGIGLLCMANFILSYRMGWGWSLTSGISPIIKSTLYQQGASLEPVFGSVIFRELVKPEFSILDLLLRNDYGIVVDRVRGVTWTSGGFGSSFFGEAYFLGFPFSIFILVVVGVCIGFVECAYRVSWEKYGNCAGFANIILFMTIPNLVYLGRSSIKDFIIKTIFVTIILTALYYLKSYSYAGKTGRLQDVKL